MGKSTQEKALKELRSNCAKADKKRKKAKKAYRKAYKKGLKKLRAELAELKAAHKKAKKKKEKACSAYHEFQAKLKAKAAKKTAKKNAKPEKKKKAAPAKKAQIAKVKTATPAPKAASVPRVTQPPVERSQPAKQPAAKRSTTRKTAAKTSPSLPPKTVTRVRHNGKSFRQDDLKIVEGIGPKIESLLHAGGIKTWADLGEAPIATLRKILTDAGPRFSFHKPDTWAQQARLADTGKFDQLKALQDELDGGVKKG